jgi:TRAP-type C4-dicarboxylate transport system substrate-binding protein
VKHKKFFYIAFLMILVMMITGCSTPTNNKVEGQEDQTYVIKIGHAAAKEHFAQSSFEKFKELVESNSKGKIKVEIYPEGELGGERKMLEQALLGELTMIAPASAPLDAVSKYMAVLDLPYLFNDRDTAYKALDGEIGQEILDSLSDKGIIGLVFLGKWFQTFNQ